jgi:hypothetical protein
MSTSTTSARAIAKGKINMQKTQFLFITENRFDGCSWQQMSQCRHHESSRKSNQPHPDRQPPDSMVPHPGLLTLLREHLVQRALIGTEKYQPTGECQQTSRTAEH